MSPEKVTSTNQEDIPVAPENMDETMVMQMMQMRGGNKDEYTEEDMAETVAYMMQE